MKGLLRIIPLLTMLMFPVSLTGQEPGMDAISLLAEELAVNDTDPETLSRLVDRLQELVDNPVMINTGEKAEISRLFFLSDMQVDAIVSYIFTTGQILSVYEIGSIPGFDKATADRMRPFISLADIALAHTKAKRCSNSILSNLIIKPGEKDTTSPGSMLKSLSRYRFDSGRFSAGLTAEKDAGEQFLTGSPPLPDFLSVSASYSGEKYLDRIIIGDYSARFGQGISVNSGFSTALSLSSQGYTPARDEIEPYTSTDENRFFRGVAAEFTVNKLGFSMFISRDNKDASIGLSSDSVTRIVKNLYTSGLHDTPSSLAKKDALSLTTVGINAVYNLKPVRIGILWTGNRFGLPFSKDAADPRELYKFEGRNNSTLSAYYTGQAGRFLFSGELALNDPANISAVQGITGRLSERLTVNFLYRYYAPGFTTFTGKGPGYSSSSSNENGLMGNFSLEAFEHFFISGGVDICRFPWLKPGYSNPSLTRKSEIKIRYLPSRELNLDFSVDTRYSTAEGSEENQVPRADTSRSVRFRSLATYSFARDLSLATRFDYKITGPSGGRGALLAQDVIFSIARLPMKFWLRYSIFNVDSWDSRLYIYENDLLYSYSVPAFSGKGTRFYMLARWDINNKTSLRIKYAVTSMSGDDPGNEDTNELRLQFMMSF
jgi:hypothetical protein